MRLLHFNLRDARVIQEIDTSQGANSSVRVELSQGRVLYLDDDPGNPGLLQIRSREGRLIVAPTASNCIDVEIVDTGADLLTTEKVDAFGRTWRVVADDSPTTSPS